MGAVLHVGSDVDEGQKCAAIVVAVHGDQPDSCVNLRVLLDVPRTMGAVGQIGFWSRILPGTSPSRRIPYA
jgi:hypothetical protein